MFFKHSVELLCVLSPFLRNILTSLKRLAVQGYVQFSWKVQIFLECHKKIIRYLFWRYWVGDFFQIMWPPHNIWTLKWTENWKNTPWFTIPWNSKSSHECRLDYIAFPCDTFRREFRNENDWYSHRKVGFSRRTHTQWFHFLGFIAVGWRHLCFYAFLMIENIMTKISVI